MRNIFFASILIVIAYSCCLLPAERTWTDEYVIENGTDHTVTIYYRFTEDIEGTITKLDTIEIMPNSEYIELDRRGFNTDSPGVFPFTTDSVLIKFDNEKILLQICDGFFKEECMVERNIVNYWNESNYSKKTIGRGDCGAKEYRYTYTITEKDYDNAVPIEE